MCELTPHPEFALNNDFWVWGLRKIAKGYSPRAILLDLKSNCDRICSNNQSENGKD
jgi:hypothetical protein